MFLSNLPVPLPKPNTTNFPKIAYELVAYIKKMCILNKPFTIPSGKTNSFLVVGAAVVGGNVVGCVVGGCVLGGCVVGGCVVGGSVEGALVIGSKPLLQKNIFYGKLQTFKSSLIIQGIRKKSSPFIKC